MAAAAGEGGGRGRAVGQAQGGMACAGSGSAHGFEGGYECFSVKIREQSYVNFNKFIQRQSSVKWHSSMGLGCAADIVGHHVSLLSYSCQESYKSQQSLSVFGLFLLCAHAHVRSLSRDLPHLFSHSTVDTLKTRAICSQARNWITEYGVARAHCVVHRIVCVNV